MSMFDKFKKLTENRRHPEEVSNWIFSLTPLGVAFSFYFVFLLPMEIENKDLLYVLGAMAGFGGLQGYWIYRGWIRNEGSTVILGLAGLAVALLLTYAYINFR